MSTMCWDHCLSCDLSQNRFWVDNNEHFEKQRAETLNHKCGFCGGELVSYMSPPGGWIPTTPIPFENKDETPK